jgi:hypothetical protein
MVSWEIHGRPYEVFSADETPDARNFLAVTMQVVGLESSG